MDLETLEASSRMELVMKQLQRALSLSSETDVRCALYLAADNCRKAQLAINSGRITAAMAELQKGAQCGKTKNLSR